MKKKSDFRRIPYNIWVGFLILVLIAGAWMLSTESVRSLRGFSNQYYSIQQKYITDMSNFNDNVQGELQRKEIPTEYYIGLHNWKITTEYHIDAPQFKRVPWQMWASAIITFALIWFVCMAGITQLVLHFWWFKNRK